MTVRAKVKVESVIEFATYQNQGVSKRVKFVAEYDTSIPEDERFQKATPSATAEFHIDNPAAADQFKPGDFYYVDFIPVPKS